MSAVAPEREPAAGARGGPNPPTDSSSTASRDVRLEARLWLIQRASAVVLALCVIVHLVTIVIAVRSGLSAAAILGRLRGSLGWLAFYAVFVISVALHAPIGLRAIAAEWLGWRGRFLNAATLLTGALLLALGLHSMAGLFGSAA